MEQRQLVDLCIRGSLLKRERMHWEGVTAVAGSGRELVLFKSLEMVGENLGENEKGKGACT
jgi:hypothetical protein